MGYKKEIMLAATLAAAVLLTAGCSRGPELTYRQKEFAALANMALTKEIGTMLGSDKVNIICIELKDTCWNEPTRYDSQELAALEDELTRRTVRKEIPSDEQFLDDFETVPKIHREIQAYKQENRIPWGYKAIVTYRNGRSKDTDTINCEISKYGNEVRACYRGAQFPLKEEEEIIKKLDQICENY